MESSPTVKGNTISENVAAEYGGGIYVDSTSTLILSDPDDNIYADNEPDDIYYEP